MSVEASLPTQEEDIVYYDAKADAELVSAPTCAGGEGQLPEPPALSELVASAGK